MGIISKIAVGICLVFVTVSSAAAEYKLIVPQKVGGGTSVWASIVAKELEKYLDEPVVLKHLPSARDIGGFNEFHNELQYDDKAIMVSHGGNGVSFLQEQVDYNYADYDSVGLMNLNIIVGKRVGDNLQKVRFAAGSGMVPEAFAIAMLLCGQLDYELYVKCFDHRVVWVSGMSGGERRLAFKRGELNATRENPAAYKKHVEKDEKAEIWFHHGILESGVHQYDPNYPDHQFEILFMRAWGEYPHGHFYDAYKLVKSFRDGMQKALWVRKGNPNRDKLVEALRQVATNRDSVAVIEAKVGKYQWLIGNDGNAHRDYLMTLINKDSLHTLVNFNKEALGLDSIYKENLVD